MKPLFLIAALLCCTLPASAQTDADHARTFRLTAIAGVYNDLFYDLKGSKTSVFASMSGLSVTYACPTGRTLSLYREVPPPADSPPDTKPTKLVVAEVTLPSNGEQSIVLLAPAPANAPLPIVGAAIEELPKEHTVGTFRVVNLSSHSTAFALGDNIVHLAPQASTIVPFSPGPAAVKVAVHIGNPWHLVYNSECRLSANLRAYCVIIDQVAVDRFTPPAQALMLLDYVRPPARR